MIWVHGVARSSRVIPITHLLLWRNLERKECIIIVLITKAEKDYLVSHGVRMGSGGVSHTIPKGKARTYYLCESFYNMKKLEEYRKNKIAK